MSDFAINAIRQVQEEDLKAIEGDFVPESESIQDEKWSAHRMLGQKIKPEFKTADKYALNQLRRAAEATYLDIFDGSFAVLDKLYATVRVPARNGKNGIIYDSQGRVVWDLDEYGSPKEDWTSLSNTALEAALIKLQEHKFTIASRVQQLFLDTVAAKYTLQDDFHESYESVVEGTNAHKEAIANRLTKDEKWNYFFNYYIWSMADTFNKELTKTIDLLSRIRGWRATQGNRREG